MSSDGGASHAVKALEALDNNNVALAETTIEAGMKKYPSHPGLRAAQAYCLLKSGFPAEAVTKAVSMTQEDIRDPTALNAITHVLQNTCSWEPLALLYEKAIAALGESKQTLENLFQTYVRKGDYAKAQRIATNLAKKFPCAQYQVWTVMANLGQVPPESTDHLLLKLSTRMLDTVILADTGIRKTETVKMYVDVLLQQQLYEQAVTFLQSPRGACIGLLDTRLEYLGKAYNGLSRLDVVSALGLLRWQTDSDHWEAFLQFADNIPLGQQDAPPQIPSIALEDPTTLDKATLALRAVTSFEDAIRIAEELSAVEISTRRIKMRRGPFLANLELLKRSGNNAALLAVKVAAYCTYFVGKSCCFMDVLPYLTKAALEELQKQWGADADLPTESDARDLGKHQKTLLLLSGRLVVEDVSQIPDAEAKHLVELCLENYKRTECLSTALEWSEEGLCDGYITIAVNVAWRKFCNEPLDSRSKRWLLAALSCLHGRLRFMNNPTWLMLSALLHKHIGLAHTAALKQLDFKSIQHDSMPHVGYVALETGFAVPEATRWSALAGIYYGNLPRDLGLLRSKVFSLVSWPVMRDIGQFELKHHYSIARIESIAHNATWQIAECQTSRDLHHHLINSGPKCASALRLLLDEAGKIRCNADQTVAQTLVLGPIGSAATKGLADSLLATPSLAERAQRTKTFLGLVVVLHDVSSVQQGVQRKMNAPKPKKGEAPVSDEPVAPLLWTEFESRRSVVFEATSALGLIAAGLLENSNVADLKLALSRLPLDATLVHTLLMTSAAVRISSPKLPPFVGWCSAASSTCEMLLSNLEDVVQPKYAPDDWDYVPTDGAPSLREELAKQRAHKVARACEVLKQVQQDVLVASKRK